MGTPQRIEVGVAAMKAFVKCHSRCRPGQWKQPEITYMDQWPGSRDTGVSSATIYAVFTGRVLYDSFDVPHDPADFGRCYRLLKLAPEWIPRLGEVAERFPEWGLFVQAWGRLTEMYEKALTVGGGRATATLISMYDFMQGLRERKVSDD